LIAVVGANTSGAVAEVGCFEMQRWKKWGISCLASLTLCWKYSF